MNKSSLLIIASLLAASSSYGQAVVVFDSPLTIFNSDPATAFLTDGTLLFGMNVGSASDVTVNTNTPEGSLTFTGSSIAGPTQTVSGGGASLAVTPDFSFASTNTSSYSNNSALETLFSTFAVSNASSTPSSRITLSLSGLTDGQEYRLQLLHFTPGVTPNSREMNLYNADNLLNNSGVFTYVNAATNIATNGIRMTAIWTASGTTQDFFLDGEGTFDRSILGGAALHAIPEPNAYAILAGVASMLFVVSRRRFTKV